MYKAVAALYQLSCIYSRDNAVNYNNIGFLTSDSFQQEQTVIVTGNGKKPLPLSEFASIQPNSLLSSPIITLIFSFIVESSFHFAIIVLIYMSRYFLTPEISPCSIYYHVFWQKSIHFGHFISINIRLIFRISEINLCISRCLSVTQSYSPFYA